MTDKELDEIEKRFRNAYTCGCNAGGMCGCGLDDEGYYTQWNERKPWFDKDRPDTLALVAEIRRLNAELEIIRLLVIPEEVPAHTRALQEILHVSGKNKAERTREIAKKALGL